MNDLNAIEVFFVALDITALQLWSCFTVDLRFLWFAAVIEFFLRGTAMELERARLGLLKIFKFYIAHGTIALYRLGIGIADSISCAWAQQRQHS